MVDDLGNVGNVRNQLRDDLTAEPGAVILHDLQNFPRLRYLAEKYSQLVYLFGRHICKHYHILFHPYSVFVQLPHLLFHILDLLQLVLDLHSHILVGNELFNAKLPFGD